MITLDNFLKGFLMGTDNNSHSEWVEWKHISQGTTHCAECLSLDGCWFFNSKSPASPLHPYCHCITKPLLFSHVVNSVTADSAYSKFDPYLFDPENKYNHQKGKMFEHWGYTINDAIWLQTEMEHQALQKYISGHYTLGRRDKNGQRINIRIELDRKNGSGSVSFISGWMVFPDGKIKLTTPYGGK